MREATRLLDAMAQAVIAIDNTGVIMHWNRRAAELFGIANDEAVGRPLANFLAETNASHALLDRLRLLQSSAGELIGNGPAGEHIPLSVHAEPIRDDANTIIGVLLQAEDVGERQRAESEQRILAETGAILSSSLESETLLDRVCRLLVPELADLCTFYTVDAEGTVHAIASAYNGDDLRDIYAELDGLREGMEPPRSVSGVLRGGESALIEMDADELADYGRTQRERELLAATLFTSAVTVALRARDRTIGAIALARRGASKFDHRHVRLAEEIARRAAVHVDNQRLYDAAVLANKSKSEFLAVISHELRTPLTTIMGYVELMVSGVPEQLPPKATGFLERVQTAAWHLLGLIEQILIYARLEAGRENLMPVVVVVSKLLNDVRALVEPNALEKGVKFITEPVDENLVLTTDLTKIRQIMLNLASNAVKFTNDGEIRVRAREEKGEIILSVADTGIGISAEHAERVFDAFWQVDQSDTRNVGGAGLGLSVSRRLARLLGGDMTFTSIPGAGTQFEVRLPQEWTPREDLVKG